MLSLPRPMPVRKSFVPTCRASILRICFESDPVPSTIGSLHVCFELDHVAVLNNILFAFRSHLAELAGAGERTGRDQIIVGDALGRDEGFFEIGVDYAGRLGSLVT